MNSIDLAHVRNERHRHRQRCHEHTLRRASERGIGLSLHGIAALELAAHALRQAFVQPGKRRYVLTAKRANGERFAFVFDTVLCCVATVWEADSLGYARPREAEQ